MSIKTNIFNYKKPTPTELFCYWLNIVCNNMYTVWWSGDCKEHIVHHGDSVLHSKFIELISCLYPDLLTFRDDGCTRYEADVSNGKFTIEFNNNETIVIEGIDSQIHHTCLVNYYKKEKNENVRSEES